MSLEILIPFAAIVHEVLEAAAVFAKSLGPWNECLGATIFILYPHHGR